MIKSPCVRRSVIAAVAALALTGMLSLVIAADGAAGVEQFDLSGLPAKPTTFKQQQLWTKLGQHRAGDLSDAAHIQRKLAECYLEVHDQARAAATARADAYENPPAPPAPAPAPAPPVNVGRADEPKGVGLLRPVTRPTSRPATMPGGFDGSYFKSDGTDQDEWEFSSTGHFAHVSRFRAANLSRNNREEGEYRVDGDKLVLRVTQQNNGFYTKTAGQPRDWSSAVGAGGEQRTMKFQLKGPGGKDGIILDGAEFGVKHW